MRSLLAICLILVCFVDNSYGTFADFLNNLPSEVASAVGNAWSSITDAIKKPVRIKRLGSGGRLKSTPTSSLGTTLPTTDSDTKFRISETTESFVRSTTYIGNRLTIPLLPSPEFKSLDEWRDMQKAHYVIRKKVSNPAPIVIMLDPPETASKKRKGNKKSVSLYDDNSFATMMVLK